MSYPSKKDDQKNFEKNSLVIAIDVWYTKNKKIYYFYASKHNSNGKKKQVNLLVIPNKEGWHYIAPKNIVHY